MEKREQAPEAGVMEELSPGLRRVLAPNPSPMTLWGTNTFVLGQGDVVVIDPGPAIPSHLEAILQGLGPGERVEYILVTHSHLDHSPLAAPLSRRTGAPVLAFGDSFEGRSELMERFAEKVELGGGEGMDRGFVPDRRLADGERLDWSGGAVDCIWTPGHFSNHMSFAWEGQLFCGDHVMGWASSLVSPPDGDLTAFMQSCHRLLERDEQIYHPGHGAAIKAPAERLSWLIEHRLGREAQIRAQLERGPASAASLARAIYTDVAPQLLPAATRNVLAHLLDLLSRDLVVTEEDPGAEAIFRLR